MQAKNTGIEGNLDAAIDQINRLFEDIHSPESWLGERAAPDAKLRGTIYSITPFTVTSGNNDYSAPGDEAFVIGEEDMPIREGSINYALHKLFVVNTSSSAIYKLRVVFAESGTLLDAIAAEQYTEVVVGFSPAIPVQSARISYDIRIDHLAVGTRVWVQAWNATNGETVDFLIGIHEEFE
jgi:hypothetical protein